MKIKEANANVIIAARDKDHKDNKTVREFFTNLKENTKSYTLFTTVTTKSEFLEYYRRKLITKTIGEVYSAYKEKKVIIMLLRNGKSLHYNVLHVSDLMSIYYLI